MTILTNNPKERTILNNDPKLQSNRILEACDLHGMQSEQENLCCRL